MNDKRMPAIFTGHGSPMLALDKDAITDTLGAIGKEVISKHGKPKAILMVSAHWYKDRNLVQRTENPEQIYDMYGFPQALYDVVYSPKGCLELSDAVLAVKGLGAEADNSWGIDHGTWTPLVHMFPDADIPVVQLSVNGVAGPERCYEYGRMLAPLREQGYMLMGSGNVVHNLRAVNWESAEGSAETVEFNDYITAAVERRDDKAVVEYKSHRCARYAAPTADHFLPILYMLGASDGEKPLVFNNVCNLDAIAMTGYAFGL